jgi:tetratricopeptide (TPR) repeat protein
VLVALTVPAYLSARYIDNAYSEASSNVPAAYRDLDRAADLNPFADEPYLVEGFIGLRTGNPQRALRAFERARDRKPDDWLTAYGIGAASIRRDPARAVAALEDAHRLNPKQPDVKRKLDRARALARNSR